MPGNGFANCSPRRAPKFLDHSRNQADPRRLISLLLKLNRRRVQRRSIAEPMAALAPDHGNMSHTSPQINPPRSPTRSTSSADPRLPCALVSHSRITSRARVKSGKSEAGTMIHPRPTASARGRTLRRRLRNSFPPSLGTENGFVPFVGACKRAAYWLCSDRNEFLALFTGFCAQAQLHSPLRRFSAARTCRSFMPK